MKILIAGDSFAADYTKKDPNQIGWPNLLAKNFAVTNLAQAGCSEYKIYQQLLTQPLDTFDVVLVCHTSPYRIYTTQHPAHVNDPLHHNCDFIYSDVQNLASRFPELKCVVEFYEKYFDLDHARFVHNLVCEKIQNMLATVPGRVWHMTSLDQQGLFQFNNHLDFYQLFQTHRGDANHFDPQANHHIYQTLLDLISTKQID